MSKKTQRELINDACNEKGITVKELCNILGINSTSYFSTIRREHLSVNKYLLISNYLNLDLNILMNAPFDKPRNRYANKVDN